MLHAIPLMNNSPNPVYIKLTLYQLLVSRDIELFCFS